MGGPQREVSSLDTHKFFCVREFFLTTKCVLPLQTLQPHGQWQLCERRVELG